MTRSSPSRRQRQLAQKQQGRLLCRSDSSAVEQTQHDAPLSSIVKSNQSAYHTALANTFNKDRHHEPPVLVTTDVEGNETIHGFGAAVVAKYCTTEPASKLKAMQLAQAIAIKKLDSEKQVPRDVVFVLLEIARLLEDMENRADNPLVKYANHPGRGSVHDSHWDKDARRYLAAAARARCKLAKGAWSNG
jgi:hypothetical protein